MAGLVANWQVGGATARGAAHLRRGAPNQDAIAWSGDAARSILAVSDGHGAPPHFRSEIGARLAVEAALAVLAEMAPEAALPDRIAEHWRSAVARHLAASPITQGAAADARLAYGATLLAAHIDGSGLTLVQIGDGDILVGCRNGRLIRPLPDDQGLTGEQTHSLCEDGAEQRFRTARLDLGQDGDAPAFVMLSSDGLAKSFRDDREFMALAATWRETIAARGLEAVTSGLERWLDDASTRGSGDDISLGFLVEPEALGSSTAAKTGATATTRVLRPVHFAAGGIALGLGALAVLGGLTLCSRGTAPAPPAASLGDGPPPAATSPAQPSRTAEP